MRVLLTGGSGFVGSYVARELVARSHEVVVLHRVTSDLWRLDGLDNNISRELCPLQDSHTLSRLIRSYKPDAIAHLGWRGVGNKDHNNTANWRNVGLTMELLEVAARHNIKHFVGVGSQAEYGLHSGVISEDSPTKPVTMYGTAKLATYNLASQAAALLGVRFCWMRIFSSYGPRDNPGWFLPYLVKSLLSGERPSVTAGEQMWDYVDVRDVACAVAHALENHEMTGPYNIGGGQPEQLRKTMERVARIVGNGVEIGFGERPYADNQIMHLEADISRLRAAGWEPKIGLDKGLRDLVDWMKTQ